MKTPLDSALDVLNEFLSRLLDSVLDMPGTTEGRSKYRLDVLRRAFAADAVAIVNFADDTVSFSQWSEPNDLQEYSQAMQRVSQIMVRERKAALGHQAALESGDSLYAAPLGASFKGGIEVLFVLNAKIDVTELGEMAAVLAKEFLTSPPDRDDSFGTLELRLLTELRKTFGRLPMELYERAYMLYRAEISSLNIKFEPIVRLENDGSCGGIRSFEALARRRASDRSAPGQLLGLCNAWGARFTIERDQIIASIALDAYRSYQEKLGGHGVIPPVAVNVAIRSLLSAGYVRVLREAIARNKLEGSLTLEISEQDEIVLPASMTSAAGPMEAFRQYLVNLARDLEVNFAIDDFGVGQSSLDRLSSLSLTQIKIDRSILRHPCRLDELRLIVKIADEALAGGAPDSRIVVLEGLDENILGAPGHLSLPLRDIHAAGIRFIQGYVTGDLTTIDLRSPREGLTERIQSYW